jgi:Family of unknown function (DUF6084)
MFDLNYQVEGAEPLEHAAAPMLALKLRVTNSDPQQQIHNILLECQIRIEPTRRSYDPAEQRRLIDLFGEPARWGDTMRSLLWTHAGVTVPPFAESTLVDLRVPCTFDFNVGATKYFSGLSEGEVPLTLLFSGTVFYAAEVGLQVARVPWEKETRYRLPVSVWQQMMDRYYPNVAWLCCRRDVFQRLYQYMQQHGIPSWEQALERLLDRADDQAADAPAAEARLVKDRVPS